MEKRGNQLIDRIVSGENDSIVSELLTEFFNGYPIEKLLILLHSDVESAFKAGAWIASELGNLITPLVSEIAQLLNHPSRNVRFFLLDAILAGATKDHGKEISRAVMLLQDNDEAVRWKALRFLSNAKPTQLASCIPYLDNSFGIQVAWLLDIDNNRLRKDDIILKLEDKDKLTRMFGAIAATRISKSDSDPLRQAAVSADQEVSSFANFELRVIKEP
jgi:hypothetical protein